MNVTLWICEFNGKVVNKAFTKRSAVTFASSFNQCIRVRGACKIRKVIAVMP